MVILLQVIKFWRYICKYCLIHHVLLSSVERRTINDQEATWRFYYVFFYLFIYLFSVIDIQLYSQLYHLNAKM